MDVLRHWMSTRLTAAEMRTDRSHRGLQVNIAVGYGGRQEIVDAIKSMLEAGLGAGPRRSRR